MMNYKTWPEVIVNLPWDTPDLYEPPSNRRPWQSYDFTVQDSIFGEIYYIKNPHYIEIILEDNTIIQITGYQLEKKQLNADYMCIKKLTDDFGKVTWLFMDVILEFGVKTDLTYEYIEIRRLNTTKTTELNNFLASLPDFDILSVDFITNPIDKINYVTFNL